jgi:predicted glycoside hydrolase/deacetylase ChbG (UPF0249 family)
MDSAPDDRGTVDRPRLPRLIITADDFGRDASCTQAIADSLANGQISSTSIMANGHCFEMACELARTRGVGHRIGVHLVLDEGPPMSPQMRRFADPAGNLCVRRRLIALGAEFARAIEAECAAQISRVIEAGIRPTHLDSHRHIHTALPIGRIVVALARRFNIRYVRPARNLSRSPSASARAYKWMFNRYVAARTDTAQYFGDLEDFFEHRYAVRDASLIECMVHLDASPRGASGLRLIRSEEFDRFLRDYRLVGHADAGY